MRKLIAMRRVSKPSAPITTSHGAGLFSPAEFAVEREFDQDQGSGNQCIYTGLLPVPASLVSWGMALTKMIVYRALNAETRSQLLK